MNAILAKINAEPVLPLDSLRERALKASLASLLKIPARPKKETL